MRPFTNLITYDEALKIVISKTPSINDTETIPITAANGRVCAESVVSNMNVPPFDRAAEDGYAVRAEDTFGAGTYSPVKLKLVGKINTGEWKNIVIKEGECVQVATGAIIPNGANAVVRVEDTEMDGEYVNVYRPVHPGFDIAPAGEDIQKGDTVIEQGALLTPARIGVLAAIGLSEVNVYKKPRIAIVPTGDELTEPGKPLEPGKIYDVNTYTIAAVVMENGGEPVIMPYARDDVDAVKNSLLEALSSADMVVFSGGSSVGDRDVLIDVVSSLGTIEFHGVAIKPGKPTWFALVDGKPVLGLPGFPTSCLSDAYLFLVPALRKMAHLPPREWKTVRVKMGRRITSTLGRRQFFTVRIENDVAQPVYKTSGAITSLALADGFIIIPENVDLVEKGEEVTVYMWR